MNKLDLKLLELLGKNCRLSNITIAKALNLSKDTVRNKTRNFEKEGTITHYNTILDLRVVGISKFHILIKLKNETKKQEIVKILKRNRSISFFNSFIGRYDLHLIIDTKDVYSFEKVKNNFLGSMNNNIHDYFILNFVHDIKHTNLLPELKLNTTYNKKLDSSFSSIMPDPFEAEENYSCKRINKLDVEILRLLCKKPKITLVEMAEILKYNRETIKQRIIKLIKNKIIINFGANLSFDRFGYVTYFLMIKTTKKTEIGVIKNLSNVFYAAKVQGKYNIIMYIIAKDPQQLKETMSKITAKIGRDILDMEILIFDELIVYSQLPPRVVEEIIP